MVSSITFIVVGTLVIIFRKKFAISSLEFQRKAFGIKYGEKEKKIGEVFIPIVGLTMAVSGAIEIFREIIK